MVSQIFGIGQLQQMGLVPREIFAINRAFEASGADAMHNYTGIAMVMSAQGEFDFSDVLPAVSSKLSSKNGGMLGNAATQALDKAIAADLEKNGWEVTHGAGKPQEKLDPRDYVPTGKGGRVKGSVYPDITAKKNGVTMRIQTVDTYKNGQMKPRELDNLNAILNRKPGDRVYWFPKNGGW